LEQLALSSLDMGRTDVADVCSFLLSFININKKGLPQQCLLKLGDKISGSPRVDILTGEATEPPSTVLAYYDQLLDVFCIAESANVDFISG
jgi:hypothetical protein